jgi:dCTP deaminase
MSVLSTVELLELIYHKDPAERLVVTPLLDLKRQISKSSIDLRLGSEFVLLRLGRTHGIITDVPTENVREAINEEVEKSVETAYVPIGRAFILHPLQFVLAASLEYVAMPLTCMAYVVGRSSWGRLGLNIATATLVAPGFKGAITFEMVNLGTVPVGIYPGTRMAQLVIHSLSKRELEEHSYPRGPSKYISPVGPEFSKLGDDDDWNLLRRFRQH